MQCIYMYMYVVCVHNSVTQCKSSYVDLLYSFYSLQMHGSLSQFNAPERSEVLRRRSLLLIYLLRSPFYDEHTK